MKIFVWLLLLCPVFASGQNFRVDGIVYGPKGPVPFANVAICYPQACNTSIQPATPLAFLCSSLTDTGCTSPNPVTTDFLGNYHFYLSTSQVPYTLQVYGPQVAAPDVQTDQGIVAASGGTGCTVVSSGVIPESNGTTCVNSPVSDNGVFLSSTEPIHVPAGIGSSFFSNQQTTACAGASSLGTFAFTPGCSTLESLQSMPSATSSGNAVGLLGRTGQGGGGNIPLLIGTVGESVGAATVSNSQWGMAAIGGMTNNTATVPLNGGLYATAVNNNVSSRTATLNEAVDVITSVSSGDTNVTDIGIHVESPTFKSGGTMSAHYGILMEDQTATSGGTNVSPHGFWELGAAPNQFGGTINGVSGFQQNGTALGLACGTTTACANTAKPLTRFVYGTVPLSSGAPSTAVVTGISPAFTSTSTYNCTLTNMTTAVDSLSVANTSSSSITITGPSTVTDTVSYICIGT
jgi:hypothetical protein